MKKFDDKIHEFLIKRGIPHEYTTDIALKIEDPLKFIELLKHYNAYILGGDVMKKVNNYVDFTYDS